MGTREDDPSAAIRREIVTFLKSYNDEIGKAIVARVRDADLGVDFNDEDVAWLRTGASEAINVIVTTLEEGDQWSGPLPPSLVVQIQYMARMGMSLESILRTFSIVPNAFFEFLSKRFSDLPLSEDALHYALSWQSRNGDRLMNEFASEYAKQVERLNRLPSRQLATQVQKLLAGGSGDHADLDYRLDAHHIGLTAFGERAALECRRMAEGLGCELLFMPRVEDEEEVEDAFWAWFGSRRRIAFEQFAQQVDNKRFLFLAAGEPRYGLDGWRLTHREAQSAMEVALLQPPGLTRYSDVALVADALRHEVTGESLIERYLKPLNEQRDGDRVRETVRAYLGSDCNAASTAAALGVNRHTVQRRLKRVEEAIGEPLAARRAELDVALRLEQLTAQSAEGEQASPR